MQINTRLAGFIDRDSRPRYQPQGSHRYAKNMVRATESHDSGGMTNELSTKFCAKVPGSAVVGYHRLEERNQTLFFHIDGGSAISIFDHKTDTVIPVVKDTDFGCNWNFKSCQWLGFGHSVSKTIAPCNELILYFASGNTYYKVNIDEMLDKTRKEAIKKLDEPCEYFKLIKCISGPRLKLRTLRSGGRDLTPGQYYACARFTDETGNSSNWSVIEGPAFIGSKYNKATDKSKQSIRIECRNLNKEYSRIEIAVIPPIGSQEQDVAYVIYDGAYSSNGAEVTYYSPSQHYKTIPITELLVKDIKYIRGSGMMQNEGKLHLFKTLQEFNPDLQQHYNKVQVYIDAYLVPSDKAHLFPSMPHDEVVPVGIELMYCDQTYTPAFHVPGRNGGSNPFTCACDDLPPGHTGNNAQLVKEHITLNWTNKDENSAGELCFTGGQQTTENEGYKPIKPCTEKPIEERSSEDNDCVDHKADRDSVQDNIDASQTDNDDVDSCLDCASETVKADLDETQGFLTKRIEQLTDLFRTDEDVAADCTIGDHSTIREAAKTLYNEAIINAEKDEEITYRTTLGKTGGSSITGLNATRTAVRGEDCVIEEVKPILWQTWLPASWESSIEYPKSTNCKGEYHYRELAGEKIRHVKTPGPHQIPFAITAQMGVQNRHDPSNVPGKDTYVVKLGLRVENVYIPTNDELPKPLDKNTPYRVVIGKPEQHNKSTLMWGYATHTYKGKIGGKEYAVPRAGVNAYPACDQSIDNNDSHLGEDWDKAIYNIHSPNALLDGADSGGDYISVYGRVYGKGWVYQQYGKDRRAKDDENPKDRRGMRGAVNLNNFEAYGQPFQTCIKGVDFAEHNTSLQNPDGIEYPCLNKHREASLFVQTNDAFPTIGTDNKDHSCNGGGLDHEYPTDGEAWLVAVKRINKQQYGSVESLQYIDIGLRGKTGETSVSGLVGTVYVQKWSHKRTNFFSDKVGNVLNVDYPETAAADFLGKAGAEGRDRGVCDPPNRRGYRMKEFMGFWNGNTLPENGDKRDPKNMANMHPTKGAKELENVWAADTDLFFPRTFTCLNYVYIESDINLHYRGSNLPETREVYAEQLQGLDLDSSIHGQDIQDSWLDDFHSEQLQASKKQANKKIMIRVMLTLIVPALFGWGVGSIDTPLQAGMAMFASPAILALWLLAVYNIFSPKKIDKFLGIPECKTDDEGARDEDNLRGLKDNWLDYNYGYSSVNDLNVFLAMPFIYNTCICEKYSNVIYSSNRQIHTSPWDAYSNFQALSFTGIPADAGLLQNIVVYGNQVFAHTTDGIYLLQQKNVSIPSSIGEQLLGSSAFIENPVKIQDGAFEGFIGTEDPNSAIVSRHGYLFFDKEGRSLVQYSGQFQRLNNKTCGLYEYMKDYTPFCSEGTCRDQLTPESTHYTFGYDPETERYLVTKHDSKPWTWSYDIGAGKFVSEHTYVPDFYFWDRFKLYGVKDGNIYRFNEEGSYGNYFGKKAGCEIEVVATNGQAFRFRDAEIDTEVNQIVGGKPTLLDRQSTFNTALIYNDFIDSGELPLVFKESTGIKREPEIVLKRSSDSLNWTFNRVRANEISRDIPLITYEDCNGIPKHNDTNVDGKNEANVAKYVKGRYLIYNFKYDNKDQIIFNGLVTNTQEDAAQT